MSTPRSRDRDEGVLTRRIPNALAIPVIVPFYIPSQNLIGTSGGREADLAGIGVSTPRSRDRDEGVLTRIPNALAIPVIVPF